jgi:hypothetical protein
MPLLRKESYPIVLGLYRLLAEVEPSSLFEKSDRGFDDLQIWHPQAAAWSEERPTDIPRLF